MLDFFTIFSKGGLVLWCFQGVRGPAAACTAPVNALIRSVLLQVSAPPTASRAPDPFARVVFVGVAYFTHAGRRREGGGDPDDLGFPS